MESTNNIINDVLSQDSDIDNALAEVKGQGENEPDESQNDSLDAPKEEAVEKDEVDNEEENSDEDEKDDLDNSLEALKKANSKKKRYIQNLRQRNKEYEAEIAKLKAEKYEPKQLKEEDFDGTYAEFIKQQALEEFRAELSQNQQKQRLEEVTRQSEGIKQEQLNYVAEEVALYAKESEDFAKVVSASAQQFDAVPEEIQNLFFELESPTLAVYALTKEGRVGQLSNMSPYMAAAEIKAAEARGERYLQQSKKKAVSNAPAPVEGVRGSGKAATKRISDRSPDELYDWLKK